MQLPDYPDYDGLEEGQDPEDIEASLSANPIVRRVEAAE